jgi:hypothetical protein
MLRPTRRPATSLAGLVALLFSLVLMWPAGIAAAAPNVGNAAAGASRAAAHPDRAPALAGRGVKAADAGRGQRPDMPPQKLTIDRTLRNPSTSSGDRSVRAPAPAAVQATDSGAPAATSFGPWEGLDEASAAASCGTGQPGCDPLEPPDPWVAVGPDDVVQTVNTDLRFTTRENVPTAETLDAYEFFRLDDVVIEGTTYTINGYADPRWMFDQRHNRWLGIMMGWHCDADGVGLDSSFGFVFGAISITDDPTGDYYQYVIVEKGFLRDFPMLGTSADKLTVGTNDFEFGPGADCLTGVELVEPSLTTFDFAQMLLYPASPDVDLHYFPLDYFSPRPAFSPQGQGDTIFGVVEQATTATTSNVVFFRITGTVRSTAGSSVFEVDLTDAGVVPAFADPPAPVQPGPALPATIIDRRPTDAIWQENVLTFVSTYPCDPAGGSVEMRDCGRVTQVSTTPLSRVQDMLVAVNGKDIWYPGIGQSQSGTLHVVYTQSSSTEGMSSYNRYQLASNAKHTLSAAREIADGLGTAYGGSRWGDYVGVAQDPRDTNAVWQGNQYTKSNGTWATRVSELQTAGSTFVGIAPVRLLDSRVNNGTAGPFTSSVPKSVDIAGRGGVPADAVAITGNLTVVGQQQAGYASLTPLPVANPATSTINFPLGDNRANNITSPLSTAGGVSITYKAGAGKQTHFLLDVTGYFLNRDVAASHTYRVLTPTRVVDTRATPPVGLAGPVPANVNRTFQVAGRLGIPSNAKAITGNLTVVNQTGAGFVTLSDAPPPVNPLTSTINFPVGDTRANGVTVRLSATGSLWAVYKSAPGRSTHLILDVTGYYLNDLAGARFVALTPGRRLDTRFPRPYEGLTGPFSANVARTLVVEPYQGVPTNATAITGNLTVVGQTRAGYVSMTIIATNSPATSTLNFPLGDTRANGVTGPLSGPGSVGLVYKASGGLTHLILDLTGYFR